MKLTMTILLCAGISLLHPSPTGIPDIRQPEESHDSLRVMFWNLENFFDTHDGGLNVSDTEFSAGGSRHWTRKRYNAKCNGVCKIILKTADVYGSVPDVIGFAEVENRGVLEDIILDTPLRKLGYRIVHFDSPDHRGIDCALLYRKSSLRLTDSTAIHLYDRDGNIMATRDILLARFGSLAILVNHHPSKVGEGSGPRREAAMARMTSVCDSLENDGVSRILCIGDFNDDVWSSDIPIHSSDTLTSASGMAPLGTIKYEGAWEKIDGCFCKGFERVEESIFDDPALLTKDSSYGGLKPLRSWSGPRWLGGVSDHLPIVLFLK